MIRLSPAAVLGGSFGRSALRNPVFTALLILPPMMGLFTRLVFILLGRFLPSFDAEPWIPLFLAVTAGFPPYLYGLLSALILLDEKDKGLIPALKVTPLSAEQILLTRILPASVLTVFAVPLCLYLSGQSHRLSGWSIPLAGIYASLLTIFNSLLVLRISTTKVQALTIGKLLGTFLLVPLVFILPSSPWRYLMLLVPGTWMAPLLLESRVLMWVTGGLVYTGAILLTTWRSAMKAYFT